MQTPTLVAALVDGGQPARKAIGRLPKSAGFEVRAFGTGREFIESLVGRRPDCVILDIHMPEMTGFEVQAKIHAVGIYLPVIFITAFEDLDLALRLEQAGAAGFLPKPFTGEELLQAIERAVGGVGNMTTAH